MTTTPTPKPTTPEDIDKQFGILGPLMQMFKKHFPEGGQVVAQPTPPIGPMQQADLDRIAFNVKRMVDYGDGDTAMVRDLRSLLAQVEWMSDHIAQIYASLEFVRGERDGYRDQLDRIRELTNLEED